MPSKNFEVKFDDHYLFAVITLITVFFRSPPNLPMRALPL
jgi:hypothetical protein